jgi:hypothetical protein
MISMGYRIVRRYLIAAFLHQISLMSAVAPQSINPFGHRDTGKKSNHPFNPLVSNLSRPAPTSDHALVGVHHTSLTGIWVEHGNKSTDR